MHNGKVLNIQSTIYQDNDDLSEEVTEVHWQCSACNSITDDDD